MSAFDADLQVGNYLGDLVKGWEVESLPPAIYVGVLMHREIDVVTDTHPEVKSLNVLLAGRFGRYATVLSDIAFDYYLFRHWDRFGPAPWSEFCATTYQCILRARPYMSAKVAGYATNMAGEDWLRLYTSKEGMAGVYRRLKKRVSRPEQLAGLVTILDDYDAAFNQAFLALFPALQQLADGYRR